MFNQLTTSRKFLLEWVLACIVGFTVGSLVGATDFSLLSSLLGSSLPARVIGDVFFGASIGLAQYWVLRRHFPQRHSRLIWWIPVSIIGFILGARLATWLVPRITVDEIPLSIGFGVVLGGMFGVVHWAGMQFMGTLKAKRPILWIPACMLAWIIAELISFRFDFNQLSVPLLSLAIGLVTGIALIVWIQPE
jgi:hypothetical protein